MARQRVAVSNQAKKRIRAQAGGKCANPGCATTKTHLHHSREWAVYETNDEEHMIAVCPTCHDAIHHGALVISDETVYAWKSIERVSGSARAHIFVEPAEPIVGKQQVREAISRIRMYEDGTPRTKHVTSNIDINVDEESGAAKSECYVTVFQQTEGFPLQPVFSGHYFFDFARVDGVWRFTKREIRYGLVGDLSAHLKAPSEAVPNT